MGKDKIEFLVNFEIKNIEITIALVVNRSQYFMMLTLKFEPNYNFLSFLNLAASSFYQQVANL